MDQAAEPAHRDKVKIRVLTRRGRKRKLKRALIVVGAVLGVVGVLGMLLIVVPKFLSGLADRGDGGGGSERVESPGP